MKAHWIVPAIAALMLVAFEVPATAQQDAAVDEVSVQRVWSGTDVAFGMTSPSPDGRYLTQGWFEWDLGIIDLVTRERRTMGLRSEDLTKDPSWSHRAFFSPDMDEVAYVWRTWRPDEGSDVGLSLRLVPSGGGEPRILVPVGEYSWMQLRGWFPDGKHLLVVLWDDENICLCRLRVSDSAIQPIIGPDSDVPARAAAGPLYGFSPDGQHLAYDHRMPDGDRDLYLLNVNTAEIRPLLEGRARDRLMGWLPDGSGLLFLSDRGATSGIWMLPLDASLEPGEPRMLRPDVWNAVPLGMSHDAAFYGVEVELPHVYTGAIDTENGGYLAAPGPVQAANDGWSYNGEFSPDGLYVAYAVHRGGDDEHYEIVVRAVGGDDVRVFRHDRQVGPIGWTPDSRGVLVYTEPEGSKARVELLTLETGEFTVANLSPDANSVSMHTQVSPDGRHMYLIEPHGGWGEADDQNQLGLYELGVYDDSRRLIAPVDFLGTPRLSPDGKTLSVLESDRENLDYARIYTIPLAGGEPTTVFEIEDDVTVLGRAIGWRSGAQWTADGTHLLFTLDGAVMKVSAKGGDIEKLVDLPEGSHRHLRLHPDGSRFVIDAGLNKGEIWIVKGLPGMPASATATNR